MSPSVGRAFAVSVAWLDRTSFGQEGWFSFVGAVAATVPVYLIRGVGRAERRKNR
ncbi:hypothetical protein [Saccharopolyspora sp. 5N708]|uniref:hypothetical protein n=1 Tax=Saccharopolyspora sp. 5N708 TaxID=3457424 RepID=UPI003FD5A85A